MKNIVILAAGIGGRLKPLTDTLPKCCLTIGSETLIGRIITQLSRASQEFKIKIEETMKGSYLN